MNNSITAKETRSAFVPPKPLNTAVLFLVFNRINTTKLVLSAISEAKPPRLYIAGDAAHSYNEKEYKKVQEVRDYIMQNINWKCEVKTLFREKNLGCKYAVTRAISWFFDNEKTLNGGDFYNGIKPSSQINEVQLNIENLPKYNYSL